MRNFKFEVVPWRPFRIANFRTFRDVHEFAMRPSFVLRAESLKFIQFFHKRVTTAGPKRLALGGARRKAYHRDQKREEKNINIINLKLENNYY